MTITLSEFEESIGDVTFPLCVATSGGPDSLALLLLAHELAQKKGSHVIALTVDHGLRPESKKEALQVKKWAKARGIEHVVLEWAHDQPTSRLQEKARKARYELLTEWCKCQQVSTLLLGHHQQDQEETFWLRLSSGSGLDGLAGMKKRVVRNGIIFLRPFLRFSKARIKETLLAQNQEWIEDPSNQNPQFFRGRLRHFLQEEGLSSQRLLDVMKKLQVDADFIQDALRKAVEETVQMHEGGYLTVKKEIFNALHPAIARRLLSFLVQWFSSAYYAPRSTQVTGMVDRIHREVPFTSGGIYWTFSREEIFLFREKRAIQEGLSLSRLQGKTLWDQRFWIDPGLKEFLPQEITIGPLGVIPSLDVIPAQASPISTAIKLSAVRPERSCEAAKSKGEVIESSFDSGPSLSSGPTLRTNGGVDETLSLMAVSPIPTRAWPTLPALWEKGKVVAVPHLCYNLLSCEKDLREFFSLKPLFHDSLRFTI